MPRYLLYYRDRYRRSCPSETAEASPYNVLKIKMGLDNDKELVKIIRSETDRPICVDVNQGWDNKEYALEMIQWLSEQNCLFVEQPMPKEKIDEQAWLHEARSSAYHRR